VSTLFTDLYAALGIQPVGGNPKAVTDSDISAALTRVENAFTSMRKRLHPDTVGGAAHRAGKSPLEIEALVKAAHETFVGEQATFQKARDAARTLLNPITRARHDSFYAAIRDRFQLGLGAKIIRTRNAPSPSGEFNPVNFPHAASTPPPTRPAAARPATHTAEPPKGKRPTPTDSPPIITKRRVASTAVIPPAAPVAAPTAHPLPDSVKAAFTPSSVVPPRTDASIIMPNQPGHTEAAIARKGISFKQGAAIAAGATLAGFAVHYMWKKREEAKQQHDQQNQR